jgi:predicted TIM-barrel fold metal-dependent hydrolase
MTFVFSADGHIVEPRDLFTANMPKSLASHAVRVEIRDNYRCTVSGEKLIYRMPLSAGAGVENDQASWRRGAVGKTVRKAVGHDNLEGRIKDMKDEGIDAEIVFPSLALWTYAIENIDAEMATCQIYNDWNEAFFGGHQEMFVRCGVLPVRDLGNTQSELRRLASKGFTTAMLPVVTPLGIPEYNNAAWDPVFELGASLGVVFVLHTGTGLADVVVKRGPGAAVVNYTRQMNNAADAIMMLVGGGVLDRVPTAKIAVIEAGASWLAALAERMDEVYEGHFNMVRPKLSRVPSQIIRDQVACSFQYDRACIMSRSVVGHQALLWGADYPHGEGTFPFSRQVVGALFDGIDISDTEKADIIGGNAARLFRLKRPGFAVA